MKNPFVIALTAALITGAALKAVPAFAETVAPEGQTYFSYVQTADLDLSSARGQRALDQRLAHAASDVCGTPSDADLVGQNKARQCRHDAVARASGDREALLAAANRGAVIAVTASR
jgi:UrcA family protein